MAYATGVQWTYNKVKIYVEEKDYILIDNKYINANSKLTFIDKYGFYYYQSFIKFKNDCNSMSKFHISNPYTIHNIILWCKLNDKLFTLLDGQEYKGNKTKLKWKCLIPECGEIFKKSWDNVYNEKNCPYCSGQKVGLSNCFANKCPELLKEWNYLRNKNISPYDVTIKSGKKVWWICEKGHEWKATIANRNNGNNCPYCFGRYATKENNLLINNPELCKEWNYEKNKKKPEEYCPNSGKKVWWKCSECGYEWRAIINDRNGNHKQGCPNCIKYKGEIQIKNILQLHSFYFISQKKFNKLKGVGDRSLSYDFYLPIYNLLIEYQGQYHDGTASNQTEEQFIIQQEHDKRKREYAENHNITLREIWYYDFNNIEQILYKELLLEE